MKVSVVIPCHNAEPYLGQAIGSLLAQTRPPDEIIVVNDRSTDGSRGVAESFGEPVRVVDGDCGGASLTRNYGATFATGDAIMFFDADDVLGPNALDALLESLAEQPEGIAACPWYRLELSGERWVQRPAACIPRRWGQDPLSAWITGWFHPPCSVLWSRAAFERAGPWDQRWWINDDGEIMMRALIKGVPLALTSRGSAYYRGLPEGEVSLSGKRLSRSGLRNRIAAMENTARLIERRGLLWRYRFALDEALERITLDCERHDPELRDEAQAVAKRYALYPWLRRLRKARRAPRQIVWELRHAARRLLKRPGTPAPPTPQPGSEREIQYGLPEAP